MRIQLCSIKVDITDIFKIVRQCQPSLCFCFEKQLFFTNIHTFSKLPGNGFTVTYK